MSFSQRFVFYSKVLTVASITILSVGIFMIPSDEEKIQKMRARKEMIKLKNDKPFNVSQVNKNVSTNEKSESINVFKDL